jgi:anti-sigma regulatory factor (Ser/Thr protein kinase)
MSTSTRPTGPAPGLEPVRLRLRAEPAAVPAFRRLAGEYAARTGLEAADVALVELAVTEAVTNAVVHAFVDRPPGTVELRVRADGAMLVIHVRDDGRGFTPRHDSPGLGLGVPVIGQCSAHLALGRNPDGEGTDVQMHFHLGPAAPVGPRVLTAEEQADVRLRLEGILGAVGEAITVSGGDGRLVFCNQAAAEQLGAASPAELVGAQGGELAARFRITREDGEPVTFADLPHVQVLAGRPAEPLLSRSVHLESGRSRWLLTTSRPLQDDAGLLAVNTIRDVTADKESERRQRFLAQAAEILAADHDIEVAFRRLVALAVPNLVDWCAIDLAGDDGRLERVVLAHRDPAKVQAAHDIQARFPPDATADEGVYRVLRSGEPLFVPDLPDELLAAGVADPEHLRLLRSIGMRSVLIVPIVAADAVLGTVTLVQADSQRRFTQDDVAFAADVGRRAGVAMDTARRLDGR